MDKNSTFYHFLPLITNFYAHIIHYAPKTPVGTDYQIFGEVGNAMEFTNRVERGVKKNTFAERIKNPKKYDGNPQRGICKKQQ